MPPMSMIAAPTQVPSYRPVLAGAVADQCAVAGRAECPEDLRDGEEGRDRLGPDLDRPGFADGHEGATAAAVLSRAIAKLSLP